MMQKYGDGGIPAVKVVDDAFLCWIDNYNFNKELERINKQCPADRCTESLRRLTGEELRFILLHEGLRSALNTAAITDYGHYYRLPDEHVKRRIRKELKEC